MRDAAWQEKKKLEAIQFEAQVRQWCTDNGYRLVKEMPNETP